MPRPWAESVRYVGEEPLPEGEPSPSAPTESGTVPLAPRPWAEAAASPPVPAKAGQPAPAEPVARPSPETVLPHPLESADTLPSTEQIFDPYTTWKTNPVRFNLNEVRSATLPSGLKVWVKWMRHHDAEVQLEHVIATTLRSLGFKNVPRSARRIAHGGERILITEDAPGLALSRVMRPQSLMEKLPDWLGGGRFRRWQEKIRTQNDPQNLNQWLTASWLFNLADAHGNNHIVRPDGIIQPIDFGKALYPMGGLQDETWRTNQNALIKFKLVSPHAPLDKDFLRFLLDMQPAIMHRFERDLPREDSSWFRNALRVTRDKFTQIRRLLQEKTPTLADLPKDETPWMSYTEREKKVYRPRGWFDPKETT